MDIAVIFRVDISHRTIQISMSIHLNQTKTHATKPKLVLANLPMEENLSKLIVTWDALKRSLEKTSKQTNKNKAILILPRT